MSTIRLVISGAAGRMGRAVLRLAAGDSRLRVVAALESGGSAHLGVDSGQLAGAEPSGVLVAASSNAAADVWIDFSSPEGAITAARAAGEAGCALVCGTTGLSPAQHEELRATSRRVPVLWAANMSVGVNLLLELARTTSQTLGADWDIEIVETHHHHKVDAPSGTASALLAAVRGDSPGEVRTGRSGSAPRRRGEIGVHAVRMGSVVGDHEVHFAGSGEVLTLSHRALSRDVFADGALRAARWIAGRAPGMYAMADVIRSSE